MKQNRLLPIYLWGTLFIVVLLISGMANIMLATPELTILELLRESNATTGSNIIWPMILVLGFPLVIIFAVIFFPLLKSRNTIIAFFIILAAILFFMWTTSQTRTVDQELLAPTAVPVATVPPDIEEDPPEPEFPPSQPAPLVPPWVSTLVTITFLLLLFGGTVLVIWFFWPREPIVMFPLRELSQDAEEALSDLRSGVNLRNVILRCYVEMGHTVDAWRGVQRTEDMTPREFESNLTELGLPSKPVTDLTRLFETARYGTSEPSKEEEETAESSLTAIIQACQEFA